jgi:hypothetical protein
VAPRQAVVALVDEAVLAAEARRQGLDREPSVAEAIATERRKLLLSALEENLQATLTPTDEALRTLYHSTGDAVRLTLVKLVSREEADAAMKRVKAGGDLAAEAARSVDPRLAGSKGDTTISRGQLEPALAEVAFTAPVGTLFGPVALELGWAFGKVVQRTVADEAGFASRRPALEAFARRQMATEAVHHLLAKARDRTAVKLDEAFLKGLGDRIEATPRELQHVVATVNGIPLRYATIQQSLAYIASGGGHAAGAATRISVATRAIDDLLKESLAVERGLAASPAVAGVLPGIERYILANTLATRIAGNKGAGAADRKVQARISELRERARIELDESRLAALSAP